jgi:hypothetical protein
MGQHWTLTARCLVLDMKAPFNTPVVIYSPYGRPDNIADQDGEHIASCEKADYAAFIATAINNHEALEQMVTRCLHHFERIRGEKEDTRIMVELRNALRRANVRYKGER